MKSFKVAVGSLFFSCLIFLAFLLFSSPVHAVDGEVTYTGINTNLTGDDIGAGPFPLGFTFNFYGVGFTAAYVNINGTLNFTENYSRYSNVPLNTTKSGTNISDYSIYAFWDDLNTNPSGGSGNKPIYYGTVGTAPNRKFVTQWTNIYFHGTTVQMGTFQVILYEGSNAVQLQYRDLLGNASQPNREKGNSATIGIRKDNTASMQYSHNTNAITQAGAIRYTPNGSGGYTVDDTAEYDLIYMAPEGAPTSPTLVTPTDGSTGVTTSPAFEWLPVSGATSYRILVSTVSNFATTVVDQTTASTSYTYGSSLSTSTQYYWRVQATNSNGSSLSPTRSFTTASSPNTAPNTPTSVTSTSLISGATVSNFSGVTLLATLTDNDDAEQVRYRLQMATDNTFNNLVIDYRSPFGDEGTHTYTFGENAGTYLVGGTATTPTTGNHYLRIRTEDDSAASSSWYTASGVAFVVPAAATSAPTPTNTPTPSPTATPTPTPANANPNSPSALGPTALINGSASSENQPSVTFNLSDINGLDTVRYRIQIDNSADFSSPIVDYTSALDTQGLRAFIVGQAAGSGTYATGSADLELDNGSYYWRVKTIDNSNAESAYTTANSGAIAFIINTNTPGLSDIAANAASSSATISWTTDEEASSRVEYGLIPAYGFATSELDTSPRVTSHTIVLSDLKACARYFYRVQSKNNAATEVISTQQTFTTTGCAASVIERGTESSISHSAGGTIELTTDTSQVTLIIPANFSNETTSFQLNKIENSGIPTPPPEKQVAGDNVYDLIAVKNDNTQLTNFDQPVTFSIVYGSMVEDDYREDTLQVYTYSDGSWQQVSCTHNMGTNTFTCTLNHFSMYVLFGIPLISSGSPPTIATDNSTHACSNSKPQSIPDLFQIDSTTTTAKLYFTPIMHNNQYYISYSEDPNAEEHGALINLSSDGVQSYTVEQLNPYKTYYFKVRGQRGCMPGDWSNTRSAQTGVLNPTTIAPEVTKPLAKKITVTPKAIAKAKATATPKASPTLQATKTPVPSTTPLPTKTIVPTKSPVKETAQQEGYLLAIRIEHEGKPLANANIELHSKPQYGKTDENGMIRFENVEKGNHTLKVAYNNFRAEQKIAVDGEEKEKNITINVEMKQTRPTHAEWISIVSILLGIIILLVVRRKKK